MLLCASVLLCVPTQIDGFRFDIMGHHFVYNMSAIRAALDRLTPEADGVDGRHIYVYGEAWDFGEVALNQRGRNASQHNLVRTVTQQVALTCCFFSLGSHGPATQKPDAQNPF